MPESDSRLEVAYVLFMDIVGYSKLLVDEQSDLGSQLSSIVRNTDEFRSGESAGRLLRLPTGDGMQIARNCEGTKSGFHPAPKNAHRPSKPFSSCSPNGRVGTNSRSFACA